jgi:hypothetical protein
LTLPRPATVQFQYQAPTQECSDQNQKPKNHDILKRRFEYDGVDNVSSDQEIESDEQAPGYVRLERLERRSSVGTKTNNQSAQHRRHHRNRDHYDSEDLDPFRDYPGYLEFSDSQSFHLVKPRRSTHPQPALCAVRDT